MSNPSIQITEQALKYIRESKPEPTVTVDLEYVRGCPMQCCDSSRSKAFPIITLAEPQNLEVEFIKIESAEGVSVHLSKQFLERIGDKKILTIDLKGGWKSKKLLVKEVGEGPLMSASCKIDESIPESKRFSAYSYSQVFREPVSEENSLQ